MVKMGIWDGGKSKIFASFTKGTTWFLWGFGKLKNELHVNTFIKKGKSICKALHAILTSSWNKRYRKVFSNSVLIHQVKQF